MRDDDAFTAYVDARGQHLVRVAYLLTGDAERAVDIVQRVLSRAMLSWGRISELDDVDAYLRREVVNARTPWWRRLTGPDPTVPDGRPAVIADLSRLPHIQRAVLVLRCYERLADGRIASILDCDKSTVPTVAARGLAALRGSLPEAGDGDLDRLATALRSAADSLPAEQLMPGVRARAASERRRRLVGAGLAAVVVLVTVLGVGYLALDQSGRAPTGAAKPNLAPAALVGPTWRLESWTGSDGAVVKPSTAKPPTLVFDSQTSARTDDSTHTTTWAVRLRKGTIFGIEVDTVQPSTPASRAVEDAVSAVLAGSSSWEITGDTLVIRRGSGQSLTYSRAHTVPTS